MNEKLEKLNRQKTAAEKKLIAAQHREKQLEHERKRLTRSERTHQLCTRVGMLEKFLREPILLTDDDVMELLTFLFHGEAAQNRYLELVGSPERVDLRSYAKQGLDILPTVHMGAAVTQMERRGI